MGTRIGICVNCQEEAVIAAHGLCYACYRKDERTNVGRVDRHSGAINKERQKLLRAFAQYMIAVGKLGFTDDDTEESLAARILEQEHSLYAEALALIVSGKYEIVGRRVIRKP